MRNSILLITIVLLLLSCSSPQKQAPIPNIPVYKTKTQSVPIVKEFIGQIYGSKDIAIHARVEGFITKVHFEEGALIKEGEKLYTLESLTQTAHVAEQQSKVAAAQAQLTEAENYRNRVKPLVEMSAMSQVDLDGAEATYLSAKSSLNAARANLDASHVKLSYTTIYSPITGVIGKTKFKVGDLVGSSSDNLILNGVSLIDSIRVEFFISEDLYLKAARLFVDTTSTNRKNQKRQDLQLYLSDNSRYEHFGQIDFIDRSVDPTTGAILLQASFPNPEGILRPGLFAKVRATIAEEDSAILVPQRSVTELQEMFQVAVITSENRVEIRTVKATNKIGNFWHISSGLKANENVVYEGLQKIREGMVVKPVDTEVEFIEDISSMKASN